jgi:hypothetical protein
MNCKWCGVEADQSAREPHSCDPAKVRERAFQEVSVALYEGSPHNADEAIDIVQEIARA